MLHRLVIVSPLAALVGLIAASMLSRLSAVVLADTVLSYAMMLKREYHAQWFSGSLPDALEWEYTPLPYGSMGQKGYAPGHQAQGRHDDHRRTTTNQLSEDPQTSHAQ